jgi:mono/diheme cytochrome c family protein
MPQVNRDKESLYPPGKLSAVFLVSSVAMLAAFAWMVLSDHYGRPWRPYQERFYKTQAKLLEEVRAKTQGVLNTPALKKSRDELVEKIRAAQASRAAKEAEVAPLRDQVRELALQDGEKDRDIKAIKGALSEKRFRAEMVRKAQAEGRTSQEALDRAIDEMNADAAQLGSLQDQQREIQAKKSALEARIAAVSKEENDLRELYEKQVADLKGRDKQLEAAVAATERNQWRNQLLADIVNPTIRVRKAVIDDIHDDFNFATNPKVDMCMTCHMGVDDRLFAPGAGIVNEKGEWVDLNLLQKYDVERVFYAHPTVHAKQTEGNLDVMVSSTSKHPMDKFGCTTCHQGRGWSLDFHRAYHSPRHSPTEAKAAVEEIEHEVVATRAALSTAKADLARAQGVSDKEKRDKDVADARLAVERESKRLETLESRRAPYEQEERWAHEYGWKEPEFYDFPMLPLKYVQGQCLKCHLPSMHFPPPDETLIQWANPDEKDPLKRQRKEAPKPVDRDGPSVDGRWHPEVLERGIKTFTEWGCVGCHMVKNLAVTPGWPPEAATADSKADFSSPDRGVLTTLGRPRVAWDLRHVGDKTTREFVERWVRNPTSYRIDTRMPAFYWYRAHDDAYRAYDRQEKDEKGAMRSVPDDRTVVVDADEQDIARAEVEVQALTQFLLGNTAQPPRSYPEPPAGDVEKGRAVADSIGCAACHLLPERRSAQTGKWGPDDGARFGEDLPPGPRLTALGSKVNAKWLFAWLGEPRHYWATTRMPYMRFRDETSPDGKTVLRTADQSRADVVAWLMSFKDEAFEAQKVFHPKFDEQGNLHRRILDQMYEEYYAKDSSPTALNQQLASMKPEDELFKVGYKLVGQRGCFGCHAVGGYDKYPSYDETQPIGKDLSQEGTQDIHKFDFGLIGPAPGTGEVPETRWDWIATKVLNPRIYDKGRIKPWTDRLRMPKFNFRQRDRDAVVATVLGFVKEPIKPEKLYPPPSMDAREAQRMREIEAGRAVIARYNCTQCHNVEGRKGVLWADQIAQGKEPWMLPPNLYGEGNRTRPDWLFHFLKFPTDVRQGVIQRMPLFRLSDAEASAVVKYFGHVSRRAEFVQDAQDVPLSDKPYDKPVEIDVKGSDAQGKETNKHLVLRNEIEEAKALFDTMNCVKCHLPRGTPGADPNDGGTAPLLAIAGKRLQRAWVRDLLEDPQNQIQGTKMVSFWPGKRPRKEGNTRKLEYPDFSFHFRGVADAKPDDVSDAQMSLVARYVLYHYKPDAATPPAEAVK